MAKSKYEQSVERARGNEIDVDPVDDASMALTTLTDEATKAALQPLDARRIAEMLASGEFEAASQILQLEPGQMIEGKLTAQGEAEVIDQNTQLPKMIKSWHFTLTSGANVSILGSAQLDRMLPKFIGKRVIVAKMGKSKTNKGRMVDNYFVAGSKA